MRKRVLKIASVVLVMSALAGIIARVNSVSLALALGGYKGNAVVIEEGISHDPDPVRWRVFLAEKEGVRRIAIIEQGFLGFWGLPKAADSLNGEYEGLEYIGVYSMPAYGFQYGYDPFDMSDTMTHTENLKFAPVHIGRSDWFYHGTNAEYTVTVPEDALPVDSTIQIYQEGPEYVLHLCQYCKGDGSFDGGFEDIYRALLESGCIKTK